ncbi:MAG TPA: protein kinase [Candidatus Angelobacter sp.]|nr:protein kinase [Candidatus Angelobacter sp.]
MPELPERVGPYKIVDKLGEGGMGAVFRAHDSRLDRAVAVKAVRGQTDASLRQRSWQEARAAARVSHPNACRLYDILEEDGQLFLVMELIEGESLAIRLQRGPLPVHEAAQIMLGLLSALEAFHKAGIVHRDLKPANVLLSPQGTKVLDFGLAKQTDWQALDPSGTTLSGGATASGTFLGTPRYASPEQFRGQPVDGRSDIFSVGAILFEMLTGQQAFSGDSFVEIAHSVLHGSPPALAGSPAIAVFSRIIHTALAREAPDRYQNAESMAAEIRGALAMEGIEARVKARPLRRLIVLPFRVLRPSEEIEFLAFSLPEAITVSLAGLEDLVVRSSIVADKYAHETPDLKKIATEEDVDVVLTGALLKVGEQLRITAQLVEAPSGTLLWSHSSQSTTRELLELHDDLVRRVVESILPSLSVREHQALQHDRPANAAVYELYLRANELARQRQNLPAAIEQYERCVEMDPSYAPAWARLGRVRWLWNKYSLSSQEGLDAADQAFQAAFRLNPNLAMAHNLYTHLQVDQGRSLDAMKRLLERAQRRRNDPELFAGLAHVCRYCGLLQPALAAHHEARRLDPQIPTTVTHTYFMLGDYRRALETSGGDFGYTTALILAALGRSDEALPMLKEREQGYAGRLGTVYLASLRAFLQGNREESIKASEAILSGTFRDPEGLFYQARQLAYLGENPIALEMFSRAIDKGFFCYPVMMRDPWLDPLRGSKEFSDLLRKAQELYREAVQSYLALGGEALLGAQTERY